MQDSVVTAEVFSSALGKPTQITAVLPAELSKGGRSREKRYKTLYMLAGALSNSDEIVKGTDIAAMLSEKYPELVVIMPSCDFSFYTDYKLEYRFGHQYYTYITKELLDITRSVFPLSEQREDTAIYGCSMGGWGAFLCGLNNTDTYGYIGAQSGMLDMQWAVDVRPFMTVKHKRQFGDPIVIKNTMYDLYQKLDELDRKKAAGDSDIPQIYQSWGEDDYLMHVNESMHKYLLRLENIQYVWHKIPGPHGWGVHGEGIWLFLDWFLGERAKR